MPILIALLVAFHVQQTPILPNPAGDCTVRTVLGRLVFPPFAATPTRPIRVDFRNFDSMGAPRSTEVRAFNQFELSNVLAAPYEIVIYMEGMDSVKQLFTVPRDRCGIQQPLTVDILVGLTPVGKVSIPEEAVSIDSLLRKTSPAAEKAFEKLLEKESTTKPEEISLTLREILKSAPDFYEANLKLGFDYRKHDQHNDAVRTLIHAMEVNPASMLAQAALGQYLYEAGEFDRAVNLLNESTRLGSVSADVYYMLGMSYYRLNRFDLAELGLRRSLAINPKMGKAHVQLYNVYVKRGLLERALKEAETYLERFPDAADRQTVRSMAEKLRQSLKP